MNTAEKVIVLPSSTQKAKIPKALDHYQNLVDKYFHAEPISRAGFLYVKVKDITKPRSVICLDIKREIAIGLIM